MLYEIAQKAYIKNVIRRGECREKLGDIAKGMTDELVQCMEGNCQLLFALLLKLMQGLWLSYYLMLFLTRCLSSSFRS